jgi:hypothetical protein
MAYLVVAYPKLSKSDFNWIQEYRKKNDPMYFSVVEPHFSIIFAIGDIEKSVFIKEVKKQINNVKKINFEIKVATINQDDSGEYYHEFLVPDKGYSDIVKLHDKLYSGEFNGHLRLDIDFIPHIGIGNNKDSSVSKGRIDIINKEGVDMAGVIDSIDIIEYKDGNVKTVEKISLK